MAIAIMISTFGCNNGLILAGARAYYAMARDGLFFRRVGELNKQSRPVVGPYHSGNLGRRPRPAAHGQDGCRRQRHRLRQSLRQPARLRHFGRAHLLHSDDHRHFRAAPETARRRAPVQSVWLPDRARALYRRRRPSFSCVLFMYQTATTWPGLIIVLTGVPIYFLWRKSAAERPQATKAVSETETTTQVTQKRRANAWQIYSQESPSIS